MVPRWMGTVGPFRLPGDWIHSHRYEPTFECRRFDVLDVPSRANGFLGEPDRLQTLNEIGRALASTLDLRALYETIYQQVSRVMDTTLFFIALHRPEDATMNLTYLRERGKLFTEQQVPFGNSVTGVVIERGLPVRFNHLQEYVDYGTANGTLDNSVGEHDPEAMIFVPLNTGNRTIGALSVQSLRTHAYTDDDVQMLSVIAAQAAVAIENARLFKQSQDSVRQTQALLAVARAINSSLDLQTVLDSILAGMREVMPYYLAAVLLPDPARQELDIVGVIGPLADDRRRAMKIPFGVGVTGTVFATGEALNVPDVTAFDNYFPHGIHEVRSEMAVPLKRGDAVIGVLDVEREEVNGFSAADMDLMMLFASQAAIAIENARLFEAQQRRVYELQTVQSIVQKLTPLHEIVDIAALIDRELRLLIDYHACRIMVLDDTQHLVPIAYAGATHPGLRLKLGEGISGWIALHGEPVLIDNTLDDPRSSQIAGTPLREESMVGAPLAYRDRVQGVITLSKLGRKQFDENSIRLLEIIAAQAAIAFDRARLYEQLRADAITDPVTRLYNRRYLIERLREERSHAVRSQSPLVAIMIDIDRFKRVNDTYGHDAGDVVLMELARLIRSIVRAEDIVARYGGEEFCVLLPDVSAADAESIAERLRSTVERYRLPKPAGVTHITVSVGVGVLESDDAGAEVLTRADRAMYHVKRLGGNRVCIDHTCRSHDEQPQSATA